jgi:NitT/TauT family transport system substrate-binding protein
VGNIGIEIATTSAAEEPEERTMRHNLTRRDAMRLMGAGVMAALIPDGVRAQSADKVTLLMSAAGPLTAWSANYIAEAKGYYKDAGIAMERVFARSGPASLTALVGGGGQAVFTAPGEMLVAASRGQKFKILMAESNYHTLHFIVSHRFAEQYKLDAAAPIEQKIAAAKALKGIKVGCTSPGSITYFMARASLKTLGLDPDTDAQIVPTQTSENGLAALDVGTIGAFCAPSPLKEIIEAKTGAVAFLSVNKSEVVGFNDLGGHIIETRANDVHENPKLFAAIIKAELMGFRFIQENPQEAGEIVRQAQFSGLDPKVFAKVWQDNLTQFKSPYFTQANLEKWVTMGMVNGVTDPKAVNSSEIIDMSFVDNAAKEIGWTVPR